MNFIEKRSQNQLLADALIVGDVNELRMFPDTENLQLSLSILNAYELQVFDGNVSKYQFTGFNTLWQIIQMVKEILYGKQNMNREEAREDSDRGRLPADDVIRSDAAWFATIMKMFAALCPTEPNVKRLAAYISLFESTGNRTTALDLVPTSDDLLAFTGIDVQSKKYKADERNWDEEMDLIVQLLRGNNSCFQMFHQYWNRHPEYDLDIKK